MKLQVLSLLMLELLAVTANASGQIAGATFPEQILQETTMVEQYATQAQQLQAQYQQVYNQAMNMKSLPVQLWPNISGQLNSLVNLVGNAQGLSYASQNTVAAIQAQYGQPNAALGNYAGRLANWTANLDSQIAATLQQYNLNSGGYSTVQGAIASLQSESQNADGRMKVLQAGNQIAGTMAGQMQILQADIEAGNQLQLNALAMSAHSKNDEVQQMKEIYSAPIQPGGF